MYKNMIVLKFDSCGLLKGAGLKLEHSELPTSTRKSIFQTLLKAVKLKVERKGLRRQVTCRGRFDTDKFWMIEMRMFCFNQC